MTEPVKTDGIKKSQPVDFVRREVIAMSRILSALRGLPPQRRTAVLGYINGLFTAAALERAENVPERPIINGKE